MQKLIKALEDIMVAITFAEAGEYEMATKRTMEDAADNLAAQDGLKTNEARAGL